SACRIRNDARAGAAASPRWETGPKLFRQIQDAPARLADDEPFGQEVGVVLGRDLGATGGASLVRHRRHRVRALRVDDAVVAGAVVRWALGLGLLKPRLRLAQLLLQAGQLVVDALLEGRVLLAGLLDVRLQLGQLGRLLLALAQRGEDLLFEL